MKKLKLFFALFAMLALGVGNAWGESLQATLDFTTNSWGLPTSKVVDEQSFTSGAYTIKVKGSSGNGYNFNSSNKYLLMGKSGATLTLPAFDFTTTKIVITGKSGASGSVKQNIYVGSTEVSTATTGATGTNTYLINSSYQAAGNVYVLKVTSAHNTQITKIEIYGEAGGSTPPTPPTTYTIKWHTAVGTSTDVTLNEGAAITKPATDPTMTGYTFMGWTDQCNVATDGAGFTPLTNFGTADSDKDFYAVFAVATTSGGGGSATETTATVSISDYAAANSWSNSTKYTSVTIDANITATVTGGGNTGKYYTSGTNWRLYQNETPSLTLTAAEGYTIKTAKVTYSVSNTGVLTLNSANVTSGTVSTINASSVSYGVGNTGSATNGQVRVTAIEVVYTSGEGGGSSTTYSNYTTTCSGATVVETLTDAQFAWSAATAEATMGASNTFPTLTNTVPVSVTYESSTPATATIDATSGAITLVAPGTTTISAKFAGGEVSGTTYAAKTVTYALTVLKAPATATDNVYVKVTETAGITDGEYLIVYEDAEGNPKAPVAFDGSLAPVKLDVASNNVEVSITSNTIAGNTDIDAATFTINTTAGTIQTKDGYYIGQTSNANGLATSTTTEYTNTISIENDGSATIISSGGAYLRYNSANDNLRFRYFKSSTYTAQKAIALYKKTNGQQLAGLAYATTKYLTKLGDAFTTPTLTNSNSLTVTYSSSDNNVATVDNTGTVTIKAAGVVVITAAFAGDASYLEGSASYTLCVTEHAGTEADPYSVADARRVIDVMETAEGVYATGIVSEIVTAYDPTYKNITYNISADGLTASEQLQAFRGKSIDGADFTSEDDVKVGDEVVIKGNLKLHNGTLYEFDANNQLVSLKREKQQAGLAYEEKEHTANVGEDFTEPTLTNPNSLTVTYSSSNTALATVNATTGEVSILAAGKVTITASSAADATYAAGSASYNITITDPSLLIATLPFEFNGKQADIEGTAGMTQNGLGSDYSASTAPNSQLKFDGTGDWVVIRFDSEPEKLSYDIKNNSFSGGKFSVQESADGETYTDVAVHTTITDLQSEEYELNSASRYVKFIYTTKSSGNVGLGNISITKADHRQEAGLAWNPATVSLTVGDAFTAPTFSNSNSVTGITFTSDNEALATVNNAGAISLVRGKTGTATITATFAGDATYKAAEVTCVITVSPKSEKVVILAQLEGQWYAMTGAYVSGKTNVLSAIPVEYINGTLYNVAEADKASIEWQRSMNGNKAIFKNGDNYLTGGTNTDLTLKTTEFEWDYNGVNYLCNDGKRTFLYCENTKTNVFGFKNYAISNAGSVKSNSDGTESYSSTPEVVAPVYETATFYTRTVTPGNYGTICLPYAVNNFTGATFYKVAGKEGSKIVFDEVTELEAGKPYIFMAEAAEIKLAQVGDEYTGNAQLYNSLQGTFDDITDGEADADENILEGNYMVVNNVIKMCGARCKLPKNRAYFVAEELKNLTLAPAPMPGRRRVAMGVTGENEATGFENITNGENTTIKVIENGQLIIIRNGEKFNAQGQRL